MGLSRILTDGIDVQDESLKSLLEIAVAVENAYSGRSLMTKTEQDFQDLTSHTFYVCLPEGNKRRAFKEELENPNEFVFSDAVQHGPDSPSAYLKDSVLALIVEDSLSAELLRYVKKNDPIVMSEFLAGFDGKGAKSSALLEYVKTHEIELLQRFQEFLAHKYAAELLHMQYALVLWVMTGFNRYAQAAGLHINYARTGRRTVNNARDVALANIERIKGAISWWGSSARLSDVACALENSRTRVKGVKYAAGRSKVIDPYIDWETAAKAVVGLRMASVSSNKNARQLQYGKELRPDEKAQFIRDYAEVERKAESAVTAETVRELKELCESIVKYMKLYQMFNTDKTKDIINTLSRSDFMRASGRQVEYLRQVLRDAETMHNNKSKETAGGDLFDMDAFFGSDEYDVE